MDRTRILVVALLLASIMLTSPRSETAHADGAWNTWAQVAWRYYQNCWNPTTGMMDDACGWHYFTFWGLASNILGVVDASKLGLISDNEFLNRVNVILTSLNSIPLDPNTGIPYGALSRDTLQQAPGVNWVTNPADYGRYLMAMYVLRQSLLQHGFTSQANSVSSAVNRVNNNYYAGSMGGDLYAYYASLGFMLWDLIPSTTSSAQSGFQNLVKNGPFLSSPSMYGVSGIPANTRIDGEPFVNAILEAIDAQQITRLPSWSSFLQLARSVYNVQEARYRSTGRPEFWTGGGLDFDPGFVSEWIVWITGQTWVVLGLDGKIFNDTRVPVAYVKLAFAYNALYGTTYTTNMLNTYAGMLQTSSGFKEGIYANGLTDNNVQIQTNQIILSSARYVTPQTSTGTTSTTKAASSSTPSISVSQTTTTSTSQTTTIISETPLLAILVAGILVALITIRVGRRRIARNITK